MYVITDKDVIVGIGDTVNEDSQRIHINKGQGGINGEEVFLKVPTSDLKVYEVTEFPSDVGIVTHCYTPSKGFYKNPDYVPFVSPEERIEQLENENAELLFKSAMTEISIENLQDENAELMFRVAMLETGVK